MNKLKYTWQLNTATQNNKNDYYPKVVSIQYVDEDQLIKDIAVPGSILKETELRSVTLRVFQQLTKYVRQGKGFKNAFFIIKPGLRGVAYDAEEYWDEQKHEKYAHALLGKPFQEAAAGMELQFVPNTKEAAIIDSVYDRKTETTNDKLTPGHSVKITGSQLKINESSKGQGLFFVSKSDGKEYPAKLEENYPTQLRADIPDDLPAGEYNLKIVNTKRTDYTTLRTTLSEIVLRV